ncbi:hypothetical protein ABEB36_003158 [Hypothenemus hampei]|uniref:ascorbate ferrireductase (transmembrane) n=1 Tax=Hypothenemus hampei TaxID=57062 RepID=A0ABD1F882_HYPHA
MKEVQTISTWQRALWLLNLVYYILCGSQTITLLWVFFDNNDSNSTMLWHLVLCSMAYIPLMAVAIISFSKDNLPTLFVSRTRIYAIHGCLLTISFLSVTIGISLIINSKIKNGRTHFQSIHAILGLTSWILVTCAVFLGIVAKDTTKFSQYIKPVLAKFLHNLIGISGFVLGVAAMMYYYKSGHYKTFLSHSAYMASYFISGYIIIWSLLAAFQSFYVQFKSLI